MINENPFHIFVKIWKIPNKDFLKLKIKFMFAFAQSSICLIITKFFIPEHDEFITNMVNFHTMVR